MKVFLSHSTRDTEIAAALRKLLVDVFGDRVGVSFSSDQEPGGGIEAGKKWRDWINKEIAEAEQTHVLLTTNSLSRPWILWESGVAAGVSLLIVTIFTETATYHERVLGEPIRNREGIRRYWQDKVVASQGRIECELLALYVDGDAAIAEWEACFDDLEEGVRKRMREVAILEFQDGLIAGLREYWASETVGPPA
jgi:hypothetical protein